jgi:hypothetical protein
MPLPVTPVNRNLQTRVTFMPRALATSCRCSIPSPAPFRMPSEECSAKFRR